MSLLVQGRIRVTTAKSTRRKDLEEFLLKNRDWIHRHMGGFSDLRARYPRKRFEQGETFPYLGVSLELQLFSAQKSRPDWSIDNGHLKVELPADWLDATGAGIKGEWRPQLKSSLLRFYQRAGRAYLTERVRYWSARMGLAPKAVQFRSQKTMWGSCSSQGHISLNWRLMAMPAATVDYVVIHELAHLRHGNHSRRFWSLVTVHCPSYQNHRKWLRDHQYATDFLAVKSELHGD